MEEINLKELFDYFKERAMLALIIILVVLVIGSIYSIFLKQPLYQSEATVVLVSDDGQAGGGGTSYTTSDVQLNKSLVSTYSEIIVSRKIIHQVIKNLNLDYTVKELQNNVNVSTVKDTEIIKIAVDDPDKSLSADIANEIVKVFSEEIKSIYKIQNVSQVDIAEEVDKPYNVNIVKDLLIYILVGIVLACGVIFVIYYFDTSIKSAEEIENKLGLPVFGIVPIVKRKEKK